jgi:hypothetical protein
MAKGGGGRSDSRAPPVQDQRRKVGQFKQKLDKKESTEVHNKAVARKQSIPVRSFVLGGISVAAACTLLYFYLTWVLEADDEEE